jgi:hypothetical protein
MTTNRGLLQQFRGVRGRKLHAFPHSDGNLSLTTDTGTRTYEIILPEWEAQRLALWLVEKYHGVKFSEEDMAEFRGAQGDK